LEAVVTSQPARVFISYAHKDERLKEELVAALAPLEREGRISVWHDAEIRPGAVWQSAILDELRSADLVLLLISVSFLASEFIYSIELRHALERHAAGDCTVVPIIVRPSDWLNSPVAHLQSLPPRGRAVRSYGDRDRAWTEVVVALREMIAAGSPSLTRPVAAAAPPTPATRSAAPPGLERIVQTPGPKSLRWWDAVRDLARGVARVEDQDGRPVGTGFVVRGADLHPALPETVFVTSDFVLDPGMGDVRLSFRSEQLPVTVSMGRELIRLPDLYVVLVELAGCPAGVAPLPIAAEVPPAGAEVLTLGHPHGVGDVQISLDGRVTDASTDVLQYVVDTAPGSSGSPIVAANRVEVVAKHFARRRLDGGCEGLVLSSLKTALKSRLG
jgi:TIR domain/Trypsin-like peptidase domain